MSLKTVELQVAIPRVQDAARIQEQMHQRPYQDQQHISAQLKTEQQLERKKTTSSEQTEKGMIRDRDSRGDGQDSSQKERKKKTGNLKQANHPYKGHHLDISL
ncbi:MAG: hypothetical protein H0Z33_03755 [Bacillaceae bacterium]|nr:hypothetical protein [Bacillaceae bacterium]